jgi:heavy metal sensor kinase
VTLTTRLSLFFLTTLAAVLAAFSLTLYLLARAHLHAQSDERLDAALNTLAATAEIEPDGVEWEPKNRPLDRALLGGAVAWEVRDDRGEVIDRSAGLPGEDWLLRQRVLRPERRAGPATRNDHKGERKYPELTIQAGIALAPVRATLSWLAGVLVGLSLIVWLAALFAGRAVCRRALLPVRRMATAARAMDGTSPGARLPVSASGDELEELSAAFNGLLDRLEDAFERQKRFTGDASHQLRTPLTAILGQIEVALRRERPAEEYQRTLTRLHQQAQHLRRIVEALLFLARADAEAQLPQRDVVDLGEWLPAHLAAWSGHARGADLTLEGAAGLVEVQPELLGELLDILLDNACKYSPPGSPIAVRVHREGREVCVAVEDQGQGIAPDDLPRVFTPFFRTEEARRRGVEGLGLGLAIARRIAAAFGAELTVAGRAGSGSCFTLRLHAEPEDRDTGGKIGKLSPSSQPMEGRTPLTVPGAPRPGEKVR